MKIKNSYDSCCIYEVSCPLHNFVFEKLAQTNLLYPPRIRCGSLEEKYKVNNCKNFSRHIKHHSISTEYQNVLLSKP